VLYENLVVESYVDGKTPGQAFPIVALYPKEGTFWCDNPYAILDLPSVTPEIREAAETFRKFLLAPERQTLAMTKFGYRPADPSIPLSAPLDAAHGLDPREPQNVLPNPPVAVTRRILDSFEEVKKPVCVTFVLDVSGSMKGDALTEAKAGALVFLDSLPEKDQVRVLLFSSQPRWVNPAYEPLTTAREKLKAAISESFAGGGTALYDSAAAALAPSGNEAPGAIRGVVLLTDGKDTDSRLDLERVVALLRKESGSEEEGAVRKGGLAPPRLFTIAYGKGADPGTLKRMAEAGGGAFYEGTTQNIRSVYAELASFF
jgi:Ca-activated chloride channel family protein